MKRSPSSVQRSRADRRADLHLHARHVHGRGDPGLRAQRRRDSPFSLDRKTWPDDVRRHRPARARARPRAPGHRLRRPQGSPRADPTVAERARYRRGARPGDRGRGPQGPAGGPAPSQAPARSPARQSVRGDADRRGDAKASAEAFRVRFEALAASGVPNRFGAQRFGAGGDNAAVGLALLRGERRERDKRRRRLMLSALQSAVFNRALELRAASGGLARGARRRRPAEDRQRRPLRDGQSDGQSAARRSRRGDPDRPAARRSRDRAAPRHAGARHRRRGDRLGRAPPARTSRARGASFPARAARCCSRRAIRSSSSRPTPDGPVRFRFSLPSGGYATVFVDALLQHSV